MMNVKISSTNCFADGSEELAKIAMGRDAPLLPVTSPFKYQSCWEKNHSHQRHSETHWTHLADTASDSRYQGENQEQDEEIQDLHVDLSFDRSSLDWRFAGSVRP
jgi:hypothetical protein